ncbi:hypothetical protein FQV39_18710 [Bosea sp. F3-2]|uniref:hypothetical protein n=1 Tax=Bosea sp. F3-2 TaxID=2599640 RepID=UPI0011EDAF36|nr:hypothetical protein [Bosea sp. F3-2]QEL24384.1 hypothetical protein FQV39_18710 [Bosea sp. F3-2]
MLKASLAPAVRAFCFFGLMGAAITGLTVGAQLQGATDQSSTSVAQARGERDQGADLRFAAVDHADRAQSTAKRAIASPSQQALAGGPITHVVR